MAATPTVSVIVPARDAAADLESALASIATQTVAPLEVVLVNDGSTDNTAAVVQSWSGRLPMTVIEHATPRGVSASRNEAAAKAQGDVLALLDADDVWFPNHLDAMLAAYAACPGLVSADPLFWISGEVVGPRWSERLPLPPPRRQLAELFRGNYVFSGTLFARRVFTEAGGFREDLRMGEDWDLWIRMCRAGAVVSRPAEPTVLYRLRPGSASTDDRITHDTVTLLEGARTYARDGAERAAARQGLRRARANTSLVTSYRLAAEGSALRARIAGLRALSGSWAVGVRGAAMAVAPKTVAARRARVHYDPDVWLRRFGAAR